MTKKAAIYDPYLDTLGGGERYCLTVAETLLKRGYSVDIFWSGDKDIIAKAEKRFNLDISGIRIVDDIFHFIPHDIETSADSESLSTISSHHLNPPQLTTLFRNFLVKIKTTRQYDLIFFISDWSLPFLFSKNNLLHVQVPFITQKSLKSSIFNSFKMLFIRKIICNSIFTSQFALQQFGNKCQVVYPPVDTDKFSPSSPKENVILSVGRFDNILNSKKQDLLIDSFRQLCQHNHLTGWRLILAGGSLISPSQNSYLNHLKTIASGLPIEFHPNPSFDEIKSLYEKSQIYWHAAGYGIDQVIHPENTEHFGMAPVEAMASGAVPVVVNKGGLSEIVEDDVSGYLWDSPSELIAKTQILISSSEIMTEKSRAAVKRSQQFSKDNFIKSFMETLN